MMVSKLTEYLHQRGQVCTTKNTQLIMTKIPTTAGQPCSFLQTTYLLILVSNDFSSTCVLHKASVRNEWCNQPNMDQGILPGDETRIEDTMSLIQHYALADLTCHSRTNSENTCNSAEKGILLSSFIQCTSRAWGKRYVGPGARSFPCSFPFQGQC
jgi:hypothetical protein